MRVFTVNIKSHFRHLWLLIFLVVFVPTGLYILMLFRYGGYMPDKLLTVGVVVFLVFFLPMILLHINYYLYSNGDSFIYEESQGVMIYKKGDEEIKFGLKDVMSIVCYKSWPLAENRTPIFPWDIYNYAVISLNDGSLIKISSLIVYEFDKKINISQVKIKKAFYPWIS